MPDLPNRNRTSRVKEALANRPKLPAPSPLPNPNVTVPGARKAPFPPPKVATVATLKAEKKPNPRTAKARDERAAQRGRLPIGTRWLSDWDGARIRVRLLVHTVPPGVENYKGGDIVNDMEWDEATVPKLVREFEVISDGLFRALEEADIKFWEWYTKAATAAEKAALTFAPNPPAPAPLASPGGAAGTAPAGP